MSTACDKEEVIFMKMCTNCKSENIVHDFVRDETYCNDCGLVLTQPYQYNGGTKCENPVPYNYSEVKEGIHIKWIHEDKKGTLPHKITKYTHNIPNSKLMKRGHKGRFKKT